jgi:hypothetical protein
MDILAGPTADGNEKGVPHCTENSMAESSPSR